MGLGYDYNPRIEHYLLSRTGLQTLKTSIGAGGYAFLGNTTLSVTGEFLYLHSNVPSQDVIMYQNEWYRLQDIKGHGLGLQARLGLLIPFGSESNWGLKIQSTAGGLMKNTNSLKYQTTIQTCCGTTTRTMRREFFPNPVMMPRALFTFEIGIGFKFGSENKNDRWSSF
ncbi:MAG: hypothetical protein LRY41_00510 [Candidatus Pacebacteria bacterium]|nr:hypothetical protein [Candidatus Paceibacterota bacterium]MCD8563430.1 hypothetical protein [Candidatus Paceibacterota bacterium]